jgi:hypothetical protein
VGRARLASGQSEQQRKRQEDFPKFRQTVIMVVPAQLCKAPESPCPLP